MGILIPITSDDEISKSLMEERIPRTLRKNRRMLRMISENLDRNAKHVKIGVPLKETGDIANFWLNIARGLYFFEFKEIMPIEGNVHVANLIDKAPISDLVKSLPKIGEVISRSYAMGDFKAIFSQSEDGREYWWLLKFRNHKILISSFWPEDARDSKPDEDSLPLAVGYPIKKPTTTRKK